ncbi:MAG: metallophosphoesterase family protein [Flavobacteriales bacterium]|nr:metallophosphoesterase family protein [Flavobacteriales bacterium]
MKVIGLISDTHGFLDNRFLTHLKKCDEIWHAGDIGSLEVVKNLKKIAPLKAVFGNIDDHKIRLEFPENLRFMCEQVDVFITHIGGYPGRYDKRVKKELHRNPPTLFICGHSHILKVMNDKKLGILHMNPGAAGNSGLHKVKTMLRFTINEKEITNLEVIELKRGN